MKQRRYFRGTYQTAKGKTEHYRLRILSTLEDNVSPYYRCELIRAEHETLHHEIVEQAYADGLPWIHEVMYFGELVAGLPHARLVSIEPDKDMWEFHPPQICDLSKEIDRSLDTPATESILTLKDIDALMENMKASANIL